MSKPLRWGWEDLADPDLDPSSLWATLEFRRDGLEAAPTLGLDSVKSRESWSPIWTFPRVRCG